MSGEDAPERCGSCTSWRVVKPGSGATMGEAPILVCRRAEANLCPSQTHHPLRDGGEQE